jgi:hypothetical protein
MRKRVAAILAVLSYGLGLQLAATSQAMAGDAGCLWEKLSPYTRERAALAYDRGGIPALKAWNITPAEAEKIKFGCAVNPKFYDAANQALYFITLQNQVGRQISTKYGYNIAATEIMFRNASPEYKQNLHRWFVSAVNHQQPDAAAAKTYSNFVNQDDVQFIAQNTPNKMDFYNGLLLYVEILSMRAQAEAGF